MKTIQVINVHSRKELSDRNKIMEPSGADKCEYDHALPSKPPFKLFHDKFIFT
jgi:hypothetical protein